MSIYPRHSELLQSGWNRYAITAATTRGELVRVHRGLYLTNSPADPTERWVEELRAWVRRTGGVVSHEAAARLHLLDLPDEWPRHPIALRVRTDVGIEDPRLHRTRKLLAAQTILGLPVTPAADTIRDLARTHPLAVVELLVESALRLEPGRPEHWRTEVFDALGTSPLPSTLRRALARRPISARPTGSIAETRFYQGLHEVGLGHLRRQPTVLIEGAPAPFHPDFGDPDTGGCIEVDGLGSRQTQEAFASDLERQNHLVAGLTMLRFPARSVLRDPVRVAHHVAARLAELPRRGPTWQRDGVTVRIAAPDEWHVTR